MHSYYLLNCNPQIAISHCSKDFPGNVPRAIVEGIALMTILSTQTPTTSERVNSLVAEAFQAATIALVGVLGILTVAATF